MDLLLILWHTTSVNTVNRTGHVPLLLWRPAAGHTLDQACGRQLIEKDQMQTPIWNRTTSEGLFNELNTHPQSALSDYPSRTCG